jgi:hypothetical protein
VEVAGDAVDAIKFPVDQLDGRCRDSSISTFGRSDWIRLVFCRATSLIQWGDHCGNQCGIASMNAAPLQGDGGINLVV